MNILVFGRGVIGAQYGWALQQAGHRVDFYVRPGRAAAHGPTMHLKLHDVRRSWRGTLVDETVPTRLVEDLAPDHDYDLVLLSVQHYRFDEAAAFLGPRLGRATVLVFNNFWTEPETAAAALPADQRVWGFPMAGGGFGADGVLRGALFPSIFLGTFQTEPTARYRAVEALFRDTGFGIQHQPDFRGWLFVHFATNAGLQGRVLEAGSLAALSATDVIRDVRALLPLLEARGVDLRAHRAELAPFRLPGWLAGRAFQLALRWYAPLRHAVDSHANPEELRATCRDVLAEARRLGVPVPRLEAPGAVLPGVAVIPRIQITSTRAVVEAAARRGVDRGQLLADHHVSEATLADPDARLPADRVLALWTDAAERATEPELPVFAAVELPWGAYRVVDYLCGHTATLGEAVTALQRVFGIVNDSVSLSLRPTADGGAALGIHGVAGPIPTRYVDYALAACVFRMSFAIGGPVHPAVVLRRGPPAASTAHHRAFGPDVTFGADVDEARFDAALWTTPTRTPDPHLRDVLEGHAARILTRLPTVDPLLADVRAALEAALPAGHAELGRVAERLGTSPRTLQRRLSESGRTWRDVLDETRLSLARRYLVDRTLAIEEIAVLLGYADVTGFHRAFVRSTGRTPGAWRADPGAN